MVTEGDIAIFMETCRGFQLGTPTPLKFKYAVTPDQDAALITMAGPDGTARLSWSADGFVSIEACTLLGEVTFYRLVDTKEGWAFLPLFLEQVAYLLVSSMLQ